MQLSLLAQALWAAGSCEVLALLLVLLVRRRWQVFPFFTAYITFQVLDNPVLYSIHRWGGTSVYFWAYWSGALLDLSLQLAVVLELARIVLKPTGTWVRDARKMFILLGIAGAVVAAAITFGLNPVRPTTLENWIEKGNLFAAMLNAQLFVAMALSSTRLGLAWRHHVMRIATGWALWAFVGLFVEGAYSYLGPQWHGVALDNIRIIAYQISTVYWIITLWLPEPKARTISPEMQSYLSGLQQHLNLGLQGISKVERR